MILGQNYAEELSMNDFLEVFAAFRNLDPSKLFLFSFAALGPKAKAPHALVTTY